MTAERIFHYTTTDALLHLVESIKDSKGKNSFVFWATNIFFMNDPQEFIYGLRILMDVLKEIEIDHNVAPDYSISNICKNGEVKDINGLITLLIKEIDKERSYPFVISFSRQRDSLPMWIHYGDEGKGVCLVMAECRYKIDGIIDDTFKPKQLETSDHINVIDISYSYKDFFDSSLYKAVNDFFVKRYCSIIKDTEQKDVLTLQKEILKSLMILIAPNIKSFEYQGEKEVRMSKTIKYDLNDDVKKIQFRTNGNGVIIPYVKVEIPKNQLESVIIGPLANYELTRRALEMLKQKYNVQFDIQPSTVIYRKY